MHTGGEFRAAWRVVVAAMLSISLGLPTIAFYTIGLTGPAIAQEYRWSQTSIHGGLTLMMIGLMLTSPVAGYAVDRLGLRKVAVSSQVLTSACFMSFAFLQDSLLQYYSTWAALAVLGAATTPAIWTRPIVSRFEQRRGLALGIALLGTGLFATVAKPLTAWLIDTSGWRITYLVIGVLPLVIGVPAAVWGFRETTPRGSREARASSSSHVAGMTFAEVLRDWRFWLLAAVFLPTALTLAGVLPHMESILVQLSFSRSEVVVLASVIGVALMAGRLTGGWLIDRFWAPAVGSGLLVIAALGGALLALGQPSFHEALIAIVLIGFAGGLEYDLVGYLVARYFGTRHYSAISGSLFGLFMLGGGLGPLAYGHAFDRFGNYQTSLWITSALLVLAAMLLPGLGPYRYFQPTKVEAGIGTVAAASSRP